MAHIQPLTCGFVRALSLLRMRYNRERYSSGKDETDNRPFFTNELYERGGCCCRFVLAFVARGREIVLLLITFLIVSASLSLFLTIMALNDTTMCVVVESRQRNQTDAVFQ